MASSSYGGPLDQMLICFENARRLESAMGYVAVDGRWIDAVGPDRKQILEYERARQYQLAGRCIDALGRRQRF